MKSIVRVLMAVVLVACIGVTSGCWTKSEGERIGKITKFSHKGILYKTWEGDMFTSNVSGKNASASANQFVWSFSVEDTAVAQRIQQAMDTCTGDIGLKYNEEMVVSPFRGETNYMVLDVRCK